MSFVSLAFFIFFPLVLLSQLVIPGTRGRHVALLVASYVFYGWWDWRFCGLMLLLTAVAYLAGLGLERRPRSRGILAAGVAVPLAVLFAFKYLNFFLASFRAAFGLAQAGALNIILPVGISFYTFQSLSYTIDVYRGKLPASHDPVKFALYISFFPQLVAGPIVKASEFLPQLDEARRPTADRVFRGLTEFFFGLFKKAVLADNIAVFADAVFGAVGAYSSGAVALAVLGYAMQIYFDFSGYSDMAMGAARCLGYDLPVNFNLPYLSRNASEFWKRWHISLSSWLQQYLYIPLGGNRRGKARTYVNLMLTMALGGLWHGADWSFVLWGVGHGLALCAHKAWSTRFPARRGPWRDGAATLLTALFAALMWVPFRAESLGHALAIYRRLFVWGEGAWALPVWTLAGRACMLLFTGWRALRHARTGAALDGSAPALCRGSFLGTLGLTLLAGFALVLMYTGENPFIYFQF